MLCPRSRTGVDRVTDRREQPRVLSGRSAPIYFDAVVAKFQGAHQGTIDAARAEADNAKLGIAIPTDLTKLNRAQILELSKAIDGVDVSSHLNLQTLRDLLRDGLRNLDTTIIPSTWIG